MYPEYFYNYIFLFKRKDTARHHHLLCRPTEYVSDVCELLSFISSYIISDLRLQWCLLLYLKKTKCKFIQSVLIISLLLTDKTSALYG